MAFTAKELERQRLHAMFMKEILNSLKSTPLVLKPAKAVAFRQGF